MPTLIENMRLAGMSPGQPMEQISAALQTAITIHIAGTYVPAGFGQTFQSGVVPPSPFIVTLASYLDSIMSPILSAALTAESVPGSNHLLAWGTVQPSFDPISLAVPPFMAGIEGLKVWQAIVLTIRLGIIPAFPLPSVDGGSGSSDGTGSDLTLEGEIV